VFLKKPAYDLKLNIVFYHFLISDLSLDPDLRRGLRPDPQHWAVEYLPNPNKYTWNRIELVWSVSAVAMSGRIESGNATKE
jgi:hypothetical protein